MTNSRRNIKIITLLLVVVITFTSCDFIKKLINPVEPSKDKIATGETVDLGTKSVGSSGGEIIFTKSGDVLDGLSIKVADSSFTQSRDFKVEYNTIQSHKFNEYFIPISPVIKISNGGGYADRIIEVKVPVKVPAGEVPLAFFYDENTGKLESVPVLTYDATSVTVGTRHFMTSSLHSSTSSKLINSIQAENPYSKLIISSLKESILNQKSLISTGFKPGTDDWEFVNYGSYIAIGGQCAGQSIGAMWYYLEKKSSSGQLFGKFRDNPKIWQSNPNGYRFCSTLQTNLGDETFVTNILRNYIRFYPSLDKLKFYTVAGDMLITEEPVYISIAFEKGKNGKGEPIYGGHALVCYAITPNEGKLFISDPNLPAQPQIIELVNDKFKPYIAKLNGASASFPFPFISFLGKSALIEWDKIEDSYTKLLNGTVGNDKFPAYTIWVNDGSGYELKDGLNTDSDSLSLSVFCPNAEVFINKDGKRALPFYVYDETGNQIDKEWKNSSAYVRLKPGANKLGIYLVGWRESSKDNNGDYNDLFLDFKWVNVFYAGLEVKTTEPDQTPIKNTGLTKQEYKFYVNTFGYKPEKSKFIWNFGDGTAEVTVMNDTNAKHSFANEGNYDVTVKMYNDKTNQLVSQSKVKVSVKNQESDQFYYNYAKIFIDFNTAEFTYDGLNYADLELCNRAGNSDASRAYFPGEQGLEYYGSFISGTFIGEAKYGTKKYGSGTFQINGDHSLLLSAAANFDNGFSDLNHFTIVSSSVQIELIPLKTYLANSMIEFEASGPNVKAKIKALSMTIKCKSDPSKTYILDFNKSTINKILVRFNAV